jgi:DNA primase
MSDAVQQIKDRLSIVDVVAPYVELHRSGKNFKGKSPFSAEKTPSFYVSPDRGMYYCFSTSQGGDIFTFIQAMEGVEFKDALKMLAEKANVELVPENPAKRSERERWYAALEAATTFFAQCLEGDAEAKGYLERRGVKTETVAKWRIGYAPGPPRGGWREGKEHLKAAGFTEEELLKTGLVKNTDSGKESFDVFRDRVMFPMSEPSGKVVAFSGRILAKDSEAPKYVNSPETELYKKSELLFGYDKAKHGIRQLGFSLIVEGQFDVVMCHQAGYTNTVAVSGTALTPHHVQLLERLSDKVVLALDADRAGIAAMKRAAELMLNRGLDVKVAEMPPSKDPADMIQENMSDFKHTVGRSVHVIEFLLHALKDTANDTRSYRLAVEREVYPFILLMPSRTEQYSFAEKAADALGVPIDVVWHEVERQREASRGRTGATVEASPSPAEQAVRNGSSTRSAFVFLQGARAVLPGPLAERVTTELERLPVETLGDIDPSERAGVEFTLEQQFAKLPELAIVDEVISRLNTLRSGLVRAQLAIARESLTQAEVAGDTAGEEEALRRIAELQAELRREPFTAESFSGQKT